MSQQQQQQEAVALTVDNQGGLIAITSSGEFKVVPLSLIMQTNDANDFDHEVYRDIDNYKHWEKRLQEIFNRRDAYELYWNLDGNDYFGYVMLGQERVFRPEKGSDDEGVDKTPAASVVRFGRLYLQIDERDDEDLFEHSNMGDFGDVLLFRCWNGDQSLSNAAFSAQEIADWRQRFESSSKKAEEGIHLRWDDSSSSDEDAEEEEDEKKGEKKRKATEEAEDASASKKQRTK